MTSQIHHRNTGELPSTVEKKTRRNQQSKDITLRSQKKVGFELTSLSHPKGSTPSNEMVTQTYLGGALGVEDGYQVSNSSFEVTTMG